MTVCSDQSAQESERKKPHIPKVIQALVQLSRGGYTSWGHQMQTLAASLWHCLGLHTEYRNHGDMASLTQISKDSGQSHRFRTPPLRRVTAPDPSQRELSRQRTPAGTGSLQRPLMPRGAVGQGLPEHQVLDPCPIELQGQNACPSICSRWIVLLSLSLMWLALLGLVLLKTIPSFLLSYLSLLEQECL